MGQRIETPTSDSIADIGTCIPRDRGQMLALDKLSGLATASPMPAQGGSTT